MPVGSPGVFADEEAIETLPLASITVGAAVVREYSLTKKRLRLILGQYPKVQADCGPGVFADEEAIETDFFWNASMRSPMVREVFADEEAIETVEHFDIGRAGIVVREYSLTKKRLRPRQMKGIHRTVEMSGSIR